MCPGTSGLMFTCRETDANIEQTARENLNKSNRFMQSNDLCDCAEKIENAKSVQEKINSNVKIYIADDEEIKSVR